MSRSAHRMAWWLPVGSCVCLATINGLTFWGFGLYVEPLEEEFGWSRSFLSGAVTLTMLFSGLASPLVGRLVDAWSPRRVILIGTVMTSCSFIGLSFIQSAWQFLALLVLMAFFRTWVDYVPFTTIVARRFVQRSASAMAIATCGFGLGGLAVLPLLAEVMRLVEWRSSFLFSGVLVLAINGVFLSILRERRRLALVDAEAAADTGFVCLGDHGTPLRTSAFWAMAGGFSLFFCAQWAFLFHAIPFFEGEGVDSRHASWMLSAAGGIGIAVRLVAGIHIDFGGSLERLAAVVMLLMAAALALLVSGTVPLVLLCFVLLWGVGSGIGPLLEPLVVSRLFGRGRYASVYGAADGLDSGVAIFGPLAGGALYDLSGSYEPVLILYAAMFALGCLCFIALSRIIATRSIIHALGAHDPLVAAQPAAVVASERRSWVAFIVVGVGFGAIAGTAYAMRQRKRQRAA